MESVWVLMEIGNDYHGTRILGHDTEDEVKAAAVKRDKEQKPCQCGHVYSYACREVKWLRRTDSAESVPS